MTDSSQDPAILTQTERLLQGVPVPIHSGCSLQYFLCEQLSIDPEYVEERITTIFLNGKVVDSLEASYLYDGSILALSAAMPGLVGATLRRNGFYSDMRKAISQNNSPSQPSPQTGERGIVYVKLLNLLIRDLGPVILQHAALPEPSPLVDRNLE